MTQKAKRDGVPWSVILAGGEGERMKPFVQRWLGRHVPKQYCTFVGTRSMFQHTLDRAASLTPPDRLVSVVARGHVPEACAQLDGQSAGTILVQPENRGTAAGIFLPITYIRHANPEATVVVYPSDHFVFPEGRFVEIVQRAVWATSWLRDRLVLLGVTPDHGEPDYGWIQPGPTLAWTAGQRIVAVAGFVEKPEPARAARLMASGGLWNTLVLAGRVPTLWELGWTCFPEMMPLFERLGQAIGTSEEVQVLDSIYRVMPERNFSSDLLARVPDRVAAVELRGVLWSDWGRAERIRESLRRIGKEPVFPSELVVGAREGERKMGAGYGVLA